MKKLFAFAAAAILSAGAAQAATVTYDFKAEAEPSGQIGEAIFSTFSTSGNGVFSGPELSITATKNGDDAYVYFDASNAGIGVCGVPSNLSQVNQYASGSGSNRCNPSSDDGLTTTTEALLLSATNTPMLIEAIYLNSNHDNDPIGDTIWNIGGTIYDSSSSAWSIASISGTGDIRIEVNYALGAFETLLLQGVSGPNSYLSAISVSTPLPPSGTIPLPAGMVLMLSAIGGLGVMHRRKARTA